MTANGATAEATLTGEFRDPVEAECVSPGSYTTSRLRVYVSALAGANQTEVLRVNATAVNQTLTLTGTGTFVDTTNTDDVVQGDLLDSINDGGVEGMHGNDMTTQSHQLSWDNASDVAPFINGGFTGANGFYSFQTDGVHSVGEGPAEYLFRTARVLSDMTVVCRGYVSGTKVVRLRKNQANGNQSVSLTADGVFSDTTNTDSFAVNDLGCTQVVSGGIAEAHGMAYVTDVAQAISGAVIDGANAYAVVQGTAGSEATEAYAEVYVPADATFHTLTGNCFVYVSTHTIKFRDSGADGNQTITVTGTGRFADLTNEDALTAGDRWTLTRTASDDGSTNVFVEYYKGAASPPPRPRAARDVLVRR